MPAPGMALGEARYRRCLAACDVVSRVEPQVSWWPNLPAGGPARWRRRTSSEAIRAIRGCKGAALPTPQHRRLSRTKAVSPHIDLKRSLTASHRYRLFELTAA